MLIHGYQQLLHYSACTLLDRKLVHFHVAAPNVLPLLVMGPEFCHECQDCNAMHVPACVHSSTERSVVSLFLSQYPTITFHYKVKRQRRWCAGICSWTDICPGSLAMQHSSLGHSSGLCVHHTEACGRGRLAASLHNRVSNPFLSARLSSSFAPFCALIDVGLRAMLLGCATHTCTAIAAYM